MIEKEWMEFEKECFKLKAKINMIQSGLELWIEALIVLSRIFGCSHFNQLLLI